MAKAKSNAGASTLNGNNPGGTNGQSNGGLTRIRRGKEQIKADLLGTDPTRDYQATRYAYYGEMFVQQLPQWRIWTGRMMLSSDPIVNFSMNIRNAALMAGEVIIEAKNERVQQWVQEQWDFLWNQCRPQLVSAKKFGFAPLQVEWKMKAGLLCISGLKDFAPEDCRALETTGSKLIGMRVKGNPVYFPQSLWLKFGGEFGVPYGTGCLRRSYPAWFEKWMDHGAKRLLQLRMVKDAYIGDIFWYPPDMKVELPDGTSMSYRDLVRELGENRLSGGMLSMPMKYDSQGKKLTDYTPPQNVGGITHIFDWVDHCDENILRGADIPIEVVKASDTGSGYSGRSVPFLVMLSVCTQELTEIVQFVNEQVLRPVAYLNWGGEPEYTMKARSLVESFSQDTSGSPMGGEAVGGSSPQQTQVPGQQPQQYSEGETTVYRIQPHGRELGKHRTTTSNDNLAHGVHVFGSKSEMHGAINGWVDQKWKPEIVHIKTHNKHLSDTGDYEGYLLHKNQGTIIHRQPFKSWKHLREHAKVELENESQHSEEGGQYGEKPLHEHSLEELYRKPMEHLDKAAFGHTQGEHITVHPRDLHIIHHTDLENAHHQQQTSGKSPREWAKSVHQHEPISVGVGPNGKHVDDGHHRYHAAKILNKRLKGIVDIQHKPIPEIYRKAKEAGHKIHPDGEKYLAELKSQQHSEETNQTEPHKFSSTQFNMPGELAFEIRQLGERIDRNDLQPTDYGDASDTGLELNPHVTVLYGLHTDNGEELRPLISATGPIAIQLDKVSVFHADMSIPATKEKPKYDVVKIDVISEGLHTLHHSLKKHFEHTSTYPDFKPHITIAYVKPGLGEHYAKRLNDLQGKVAVFDRLIFSNKLREHHPIQLTGQAQFGEVPHGHTRLYRVEPKVHGDSSWLKKHISHELYQQHISEKGRLFSDNLKSLENYGHGSPEHNTYHVDVPHHVAAAARRKHHADDFHEYLLPPEHVAKKKLLSTQHSDTSFQKNQEGEGDVDSDRGIPSNGGNFQYVEESHTLYHGSPSEHLSFDNRKAAKAKVAHYGHGHYFTSDLEGAKNHAGLRSTKGGGFVHTAKVSFKNPKVYHESETPPGLFNPHHADKIHRQAGHDGVLVKNDEGHVVEAVAFHPHQIQYLGTTQHSEIEQFEESEAIKKLRAFIQRGMAAKTQLALERIAKLKDSNLDSQTLAGQIELEIIALRPYLTSQLAISGVISHLKGVEEVWDSLPKLFIPPTVAKDSPAIAIGGPITALELNQHLGGHVELGPLNEALARLEASPVAVGKDYLDTAAKVHVGSFAITAKVTEDAVIKVKETLYETMREGKTKAEFIEDVHTKLGQGVLSEPHLENILRTNQAAHISDGKLKALEHPMVSDAFPYAAIHATRDARVRPNHFALENLGLDGTNIYRADDPTFKKYRGPWDYQCRCNWHGVTVEQAASKGVKEAQQWLERAKEMAKVRGGSYNQYFSETKPSQVEHVTMPDFEPSPGFKNDYRRE